MKREHISASFIEDWNRCPYKAVEGREVKIDLSNQFIDLGQVCHRVLDRYYDADSTIQELYEEEVKATNMLDSSMYRDGLKMLRNFELTEATSDSDIVCKETEFLLDLEPDNEDPNHCKIKGIIDRIDYLGNGVYEIIDYKTSFHTKDKWELESDIQMAIYDLAFWKMWESFVPEGYPKPSRIVLSIFYLRYGKWRIGEKAQEDRNNLEKYVITLFNQIKEVEIPKQKINKYCSYCVFKDGCKAYGEALVAAPQMYALRNMGDEDIINHFEELKETKNLIDKRLDDIKDVLGLRIVDCNGNMETAKYIAFASNKKYKVRDVRDVKKILEPLGLFGEVLSVDNKKLDRVAKERGLEADVDKITTYTISKPTINVKVKPAFPE